MSGLIVTLLRVASSLAIASFVTAASTQWSWAEVPEPSGLWTGPMRGQTPTTLTGATVIDLAGLEALMPKDPVLLDVGPADQKPEDFPKDRLWLPTHRSIPGAVWMPGAGAAAFEATKEEAFFRRVNELTQGDSSKPIVTFCRPECWGSWNAGKRLVMKGFTGVYWFPGGISSWQEAHDTVEVKPEKDWQPPPAK
ncbi:rhodanese-like domain-containing protein [Rhizobium etli 8C-3]|uniref:Rhodanese-like domain-containing protein n=2 Tax=Rhizobium TaxID=379 RepID=A0A1L5P7A4_RHIET|nr:MULTISPECIES: rhodanese-like domain-containing protein [Rhizobium]APO75996.1 rhodanese-like domain-containing protein [Rhizobium etli 8C-3]TCU21326.1 PQQ-dependent catabolism-associated CXXCW motif protein [Rhizobium azibense]